MNHDDHVKIKGMNQHFLTRAGILVHLPVHCLLRDVLCDVLICDSAYRVTSRRGSIVGLECRHEGVPYGPVENDLLSLRIYFRAKKLYSRQSKNAYRKFVQWVLFSM